jgi:hypothetical protein
MWVKAIRSLEGDYGSRKPGEEFQCDDHIAAQLLESGRVTHALLPKVEYEVKVIRPIAPEVSAREPFRNLPVSHQESQELATEVDSVFSGPELSQRGTADTRGRGRRKGSDSGE